MEVVSGIATFGVLALSLWELNLTLGAPAPRRTRPRASLEWRCPYCHQPLDDGSERVRCKGCGTRHHAACWAEHQGCSVFACGSLEPRPRTREGLAPDAAPASPEPAVAAEPTAPAEPAGPVPTAAAADPVG